ASHEQEQRQRRPDREQRGSAGSHCCPVSTMPSPQDGARQVQSPAQRRPAESQLEPGGSHCSPGSTMLSPQDGAGQVQSPAQMRPSGSQVEPGGSHCSDPATTPSPQDGQPSCDGGAKSGECLVTVFEPLGPLIRVTLTTFRILSARSEEHTSELQSRVDLV